MSLWTPGGEVPVNRRPASPAPEPATMPAPPPDGAAGMVGGPSLDDLSPEERAQAEALIAEMAAVQQQIAATPAAQLVANHAMGLFELAAIKLQQQPPQLGEARLAIDAMAALVPVIIDHLHPEDARALNDGLQQLQMAFVSVAGETGGPTGDASA